MEEEKNTSEKRSVKESNFFSYFYKILKIRWKYKFLKLKVKRKNWFKEKFPKTKSKIDDSQKVAIELIQAMLKDKHSQLAYSPSSSTRFIYSRKAWLTINKASFAHDGFVIYIIDNSEKHSHSHEIILPNEYAYEIIDEFDSELEKRIRIMEHSRKKVIVHELHHLINVIKND